jgi:hypothetical protein
MSLIYVKVNEGEFTKEEHEVTSILVENDTKERFLKEALLDIYIKPYVIKIFDQHRKIEYYKITTV